MTTEYLNAVFIDSKKLIKKFIKGFHLKICFGLLGRHYNYTFKNDSAVGKLYFSQTSYTIDDRLSSNLCQQKLN